MAKLENKSKDNPRLEQRVLTDGRISLYLEYYLGRESVPVLDESGAPVLYDSGKMAGKPKYKVKHMRRKENLNLYLVANPRTPIDRENNKQTLLLAKKIRQEHEQALLEQGKGYRVPKKGGVDFLAFADKYLDEYTKKDAPVIKTAIQRFKDFLSETPEYKVFQTRIKPEQVTFTMMADFCDYLRSKSKGSGARSIFTRFKKVYKACATRCGLNPQRAFVDRDGRSIAIVTDENGITKDILSADEARRLAATTYKGQNPEVRKAFLFCLYTGLRFCDVKTLTVGNIDLANRLLSFDQNKTKGHSAHSVVTLPLSDAVLALLDGKMEGAKDTLIFSLPTYKACKCALAVWTKAAGIDKHITWHCARHTFGTNMAATAAKKGFSIRVVQEMMGHSSLKFTERYTRVADEQKKAAMAALSDMMK